MNALEFGIVHHILIACWRPWRSWLVNTTGCLLYPIAWNYLLSICNPTVKHHEAETTIIPQGCIVSSAKEFATYLRRSIHNPVAIGPHTRRLPQLLRHVISAFHADNTFENAAENARVEG